MVRLGRPVDSGNCRRSPPKTSIPAATSGRPPVRQSALPSDHFGKGCSSVVPRFFRSAPVAVGQTGANLRLRELTHGTPVQFTALHFIYELFDQFAMALPLRTCSDVNFKIALDILATNKDFAVSLKL